MSNKDNVYKTNNLTPARQKFVNHFAATDNGAESIRVAYPEIAEKSSITYQSTKAKRLLNNEQINNAVTMQRQRLQQISSKGIDRLETIITEGKEHNALSASMYVIDQALGRATQTVETKSESITLNIDLTGTGVESIE